MVKSYYLLIILLFSPLFAFCDDVSISAEADPYAIAGQTIKGTITITHHKEELVDENSFIMDKQPLHVDFVKDVQFSSTSNLILSIYKFSIPPQKAGLEFLSEVTATIGNKKYASTPSTYTVGDGSASPPPSSPSPRSSTPPDSSSRAEQQTGDRIPIILKLETIIEGDTTLYPSQHIVVGYRFLYNFNVDLSKEDLPLLKAEGFEKIGAKDTNAFMKGDMNVMEIKQTIEAQKTGTFSFPSGVIVGKAYRTGRNGQKEVAPKNSQATSQPVKIVVLPFPEKNKPPSFNGAVGTSLKFEMTLLSAPEVTLGDKIELLIKITGDGELSHLPMPAICCQPGFSGFFAMSDLPPLENLVDQTKTFKVEMRPMSMSIKQIPGLEFSYFNPKEKAYKVLKSNPIAFKVNPASEGSEEQKKAAETKSSKEKTDEEPAVPEGIEIGGNYALSTEDLENVYFGTWWVLLIIPCGAVFIFTQIQMRNYLLAQQTMVKPVKSRDLFNQAMMLSPNTSQFFFLLQQAFLLRLVERGDIPSEKISPDFLPTTGEPGKVRALMREIEEKRFAAVQGSFDETFMLKIEKLFDEL